MGFVTFGEVAERFRGKRVAIVGSAPSVLDAEPGFIDSHDIVVRINNFKTGPAQGFRTDVFYSFHGTSIRKSATELKRDGVTLVMCKCPDSKPIESPWHERTGRLVGIDFRYIYQLRRSWWFCDTYIPDDAAFVRKFELFDRHIPTTGMSAILDVIECEAASIHIAGFDFFTSRIHNVDEAWKEGDPEDLIGHAPEAERAWLRENAGKYPLAFDKTLTEMMREAVAA